MAVLDVLRKAFEDFATELGRLRRKREALLQERENILAEPATRADIVALLHGWVDIEREQFLAALGRRLQPEIAAPKLDLLDRESLRRRTVSNYYGLTAGNTGGTVNPQAVDMLIAGLFSTTLKTFIAGAVNELPWPGDEGLPLAERRKKVAALDAEIDAISRRESELMQAAQQARVTID
jgi:hypothetical protein